MSLNHDELNRYARHLIIPDVGQEGQLKIKSSSVLVVGSGGLGSPVSYYLCAAGIGRLGIVDYDCVTVSNLQRQILHFTPDLGCPKVISAEEKLSSLNPYVKIETYNVKLSAENAEEIISNYDIVLDGTDNFASRYIINKACVSSGKPYIFGAVNKFVGQVSVFCAGDGPCLNCIFPQSEISIHEYQDAPVGVFGVVPGVIGCLEATEALKMILGIGESLNGRLLYYDALSLEFRDIILQRDPACKACSRI